MSKFYQHLKDLPSNLQGWHTNRKILVFESDDWGSIRMPSREIYEKALSQGYRVDLNEYQKYDSILSETDLKMIFEVLNCFQDSKGNPPIITANCVVANPDFDKIQESNFSKYYFESILETFKRYPNHSNNFKLWKEGADKKFLKFQYHAREHLNVSLFMNCLQSNNQEALWGFENRMPGIIIKSHKERMKNPFVEATRFCSIPDMCEKMEIYIEGLSLFEKLFGFRSKTIIPTNYLWNSGFDESLVKEGIIGIQGSKKFTNPLDAKTSTLRFTGKRYGLRIVDLVRNVNFELTGSLNKDQLFSKCLEQIKISFFLRKPAILSIHRVNFCGEIFPENRDNNLKYFHDLISIILKKWPDVEFLSSDQLASEIL